MKTVRYFVAGSLLAAVVGVVGAGRMSAQQAGSTTDAGAAAGAQEQVETLMRTERMWEAGATADGATLKLVESDRMPANSYQTGSPKDEHFGPQVSYNLRVEGGPKDATWSVVQWATNSMTPMEMGHGVTLDGHGTAVCAGSMRSGCKGVNGDDSQKNAVEMKERPLPGEPVRLGLYSSDGAVKLYAEVVPFPLDAKNKGCKVQAIVLTRGAGVVMMEGTGYAPGEDVTIEEKNGKDDKTETVKADEKGDVAKAIFPRVHGEERGSEKVTVKGGKCAPGVSVPWGEP